MRKFTLAIAAACAAVLFTAVEAYADTVVQLPYVAPATVERGTPSVSLGAVTDTRKHAPNWLGAIRGGYGNPLKTIVTDGPVTGAVSKALAAGLDARGLASASAGLRLDVVVVQFDCNQYARREAHVKLALKLVDVATGAVVYEKLTEIDKVNGSVLSLRTGIFASTEDLRAIANEALQAAVDSALDDPGLRAALATRATPPPAATATVAATAPAEPAADPAPVASQQPAAPVQTPPPTP